jgi:hypothetical protein
MENMNDNSGIEEGAKSTDFASLSDEEFVALGPDAGYVQEADQALDTSDEAVTADEEPGGADSQEPVEEEDVGGASTLEEVAEDEGNDEPDEAPSADPYTDDQSGAEEEQEPKVEEESSDEIDYKAEFEGALEPFRASGRTVTPKSIDELRKLAQMGYDYAAKRAAMKPHEKLVATLEKNQLTDLEDLNYLIDIKKGNLDAVRKLIRDSNIDPMDLSDDEGGDYSPADYTASDQEVALNAVIETIKDSQSFKTTLTHVSNMDTASKAALQANPAYLKGLNDHVDQGYYDQIMAEVTHQRALGELTGLSDLEAYVQTGDAMQQRGDFDTPTEAAPSPPAKSPKPAQDSGSRTSKSKDDGESLRNRKRAAALTKGKATTGKQVVDLSKLSDEEIAKIDPSTL